MMGLLKYIAIVTATGWSNSSYTVLDILRGTWPIVTEPEPADLQWSGQKIALDDNLLMCYGITSLPILWSLGIHIAI